MDIKRVLNLFAKPGVFSKINWYSTDKIDRVVASAAYECDSDSNSSFLVSKLRE